MFTGRIQKEILSAFIAERVPASSGAGELTQAVLEVLSCIAFKQPISQGEIDQIFGDTDKRHLVSVLRKLELMEKFAGPDGRLRFATTGKFLTRFDLVALDLMHVIEFFPMTPQSQQDEGVKHCSNAGASRTSAVGPNMTSRPAHRRARRPQRRLA